MIGVSIGCPKKRNFFSDPGCKLTNCAPMYHKYWHKYLVGTGAKLVNLHAGSEKKLHIFGHLSAQPEPLASHIIQKNVWQNWIIPTLCKVMLSVQLLCDEWRLFDISIPCLIALSDKTHTIQNGHAWGICDGDMDCQSGWRTTIVRTTVQNVTDTCTWYGSSQYNCKVHWTYYGLQWRVRHTRCTHLH